ncbi:ERBB receptor feedback inhibitor 1 isoform X2 [Dunckerocampus dactyliophorus]|uniref:ERBB receptor feedback inhibitor 1 isoform X2 n=1 Tax=Dunckerocampus dactyliophorus TaxID=161453 RepID=UPI00240542E4|nr:ERBB receptor feedback inhibitor 1 isoform X2 [Dunckerocampus dactyliophorus]
MQLILTPQSPCYPDSYHLSLDKTLRPHEGDQVVPYSATQRRTLFWGQQRDSKPLPPLPGTEELMSDEAADGEVEFFTSERRPLLPKSCPKTVSRSRGQVNPAYHGGSLQPESGVLAFSWPGGEDRPAIKGADGWPPIIYSKPPDYSSSVHPEKPQIPPRIPIPLKTTDTEDKPPKIPPRVPLVPPCPPRSPSPKSLPIYINGVMPATQSFATNPQYVSKAILSDRSPPTEQSSSCIVPILKDGRQASATHYILLPPRQRTDRQGRLLSEPTRMGNQWQNR